MRKQMIITDDELAMVAGGLTDREKSDIREWEQLKNCPIKLCLANADRQRYGQPLLSKEYINSLLGNMPAEDKPFSDEELLAMGQ